MTGPAIDAGFTLQVTIHAAFHVENTSPANSFHLLNRPVASLASYIGRYMPLVSEIHKIRQIVDLGPCDRLFRLPVADKLLDLRFFFTDSFMAAHAKLHGRYTCDNGFARIDVTIGAVDFIVACMDLVTEINRLNRRGVRTVHKKRYHYSDRQNCRYCC